jgi:ribosomal protein S2
MKIPVIALINTDGNPDLVTIPVPGNTKASTSINWFLNKIKEYIEEVRKMNSGINSLDQESVAK